MNYPILIKVLGVLLIIEAIGMTPSLLVSIYYHESDFTSFLISIGLCLTIGYLMLRIPRIEMDKFKIKPREALSIVSIGWVLISFFGAFPLVLSGSVPSIVDGFFEMVAGFTTTGSTTIKDFEALPRGILFWRSFSHWIGGMGILVFTVAILPTLGVGSFQIFKAEVPDPIADRIVPRIKDTAKILYTIYFSLTLLLILLFLLGGMTLYESLIHTFGTIATGGSSNYNTGIGAFDSTYINMVSSIFMFLSGVNFVIYYQLFQRNWKEAFNNEELRLYIIIIVVSVILIAINLNNKLYDNVLKTAEHATFQVISFITTTGYITVDLNAWTDFSKFILFMLMFIGPCSGSIGGGLKNIRILILLKMVKREFLKIFHPRAVIHVKVNERALTSDMIASVTSFFTLYLLIFVIGTMVISLEDISLTSASSAVAANLGNVGVGIDLVGSIQTYGDFSDFSKIVLSFLMLFGRLELFTMIMVFNPKFWTDNI